MCDFSGKIVEEYKLEKQNELSMCWNINSCMEIMTVVLSQDTLYDTAMKSMNKCKNLYFNITNK